MSRKLDVGGTLSRVFELYGQQAGVLLPAAAIIFLIPAVAALLVGGGSAAVGLALIVSIVGIVAGFWYQGVVVAAVQDMEDGRRDFSVGELFSSVRPFVATLIGAGILAGLGIGIGFILLIVPGLILLTWWALIAPVIVLERTGVMASFGRSRELVRGNGWPVFGIIVLLAIVQALAAGILRGIAIGISDTRVADAVGSYVGNVLVAPLTGIAATVVYLRLREAKVWEGSRAAPTDFAPPASPTPAPAGPPAAPEAPAAGGMPTGGPPLPGGSPAPASPGVAGEPAAPGGQERADADATSGEPTRADAEATSGEPTRADAEATSGEPTRVAA
ncbi:MAG TPA: hypothetical protein VLB47_11735, partial [Solirubrobacteraceae bacterium]|nr:hypothetical protein [Solirubrobacteraceae bacterium]